MMKINRTAARVIDIIRLLAKSDKPLTQLEISKSLDIPKSSTFDLVYTLLQKNIIEYDNPEFKTFRLSIDVFEIGSSVITKNNLMNIAQENMKILSKETRKTIFLATEVNNEVMYIHRVEDIPSIVNSVNLGTHLPMYCTALGKAILSTYDKEQLNAYWHSNIKLTKYTDRTIDSYEKLIDDLIKTKQRGYSFEDRELQPESACVGAPILGYSGNAIAAISISFIKSRINDSDIEALGKMVRDTARIISHKMGASVTNFK